MKLDTDFDVDMGMRYDENLLDRINANLDEELNAAVMPPTDYMASNPMGYSRKTSAYEDAHLFHDAHNSLEKYMLAVGRL
jgi:hypothetical protein